ncbi:hypothetical protein NP493_212g12010 [Ridgeia piscesae]|uniref:Wnt inhibitory factor 1 n=1 Tax=Ridgeia piscesae TaxID=27915 RepID=A0AAD9P194_RIDPI|nr:hypothetical protein NP493_212g12010 [Ridgeia piscesae]
MRLRAAADTAQPVARRHQFSPPRERTGLAHRSGRIRGVETEMYGEHWRRMNNALFLPLRHVAEMCIARRCELPQKCCTNGRLTINPQAKPEDAYTARAVSVADGGRDTVQVYCTRPHQRLLTFAAYRQLLLYRYWFSDLRSLDPYTMYNPLLSIPPSGVVPGFNTAFQMSIACTGRVTAVASMYIALHIVDERGESIPGSPIKLHLRKRCIAFGGWHSENGGRCNKAGICECKLGYYGPQCKLHLLPMKLNVRNTFGQRGVAWHLGPICFPVCQNNATCIRPGVCQCLAGFEGEKCEIAICKKSCHNGGTCTGGNRCLCPEKYYGQYCQLKKGVCVVGCKNGGTCTTMDKCVCADGYTGTICQTPICKRDLWHPWALLRWQLLQVSSRLAWQTLSQKTVQNEFKTGPTEATRPTTPQDGKDCKVSVRLRGV